MVSTTTSESVIGACSNIDGLCKRHFNFLNEPTPAASFWKYSFFVTNIFQKKLQQDLNLSCCSIRRVRWSLDHHHENVCKKIVNIIVSHLGNSFFSKYLLSGLWSKPVVNILKVVWSQNRVEIWAIFKSCILVWVTIMVLLCFSLWIAPGAFVSSSLNRAFVSSFNYWRLRYEDNEARCKFFYFVFYISCEILFEWTKDSGTRQPFESIEKKGCFSNNLISKKNSCFIIPIVKV